MPAPSAEGPECLAGYVCHFVTEGNNRSRPRINKVLEPLRQTGRQVDRAPQAPQPAWAHRSRIVGTSAIACGIRRESYSNRSATTVSGIDLDNPATVRGRTGGTGVVLRIVGPIRTFPLESRLGPAAAQAAGKTTY